MKVKRLFSVMGLGFFAAVAAGVGAFALKESKAEPVKADADTWMMHFSLDAKEIAGYMDEGSMYLQTYTDGVGNSKWFQMFPIKEGSEYFVVNATFPDSYTFDHVQYKFTQSSVDKWGTPYPISESKASHSKMLYSTHASVDWTGDNWNYSVNTYPEISAEYNSVEYCLEEDPANKRFIATDYVCDGSDYYTFYYRGGWAYAESTLTESSKKHFSYLSTEWCNMKVGTYDIILKNNNDDGGIVEIKKHEAASESYIYYVTNSASQTGDYIYSWGGSMQFGSFPGTSIVALVSANKAEEVTTNGVLHFQGGETAKLIYKIKVTTGYPTGDSMFMFNNGTSEYKSDEREIEFNNAYWWTGSANNDAAQALNFLVTAESFRNGAADYSVCNIAEGNAKTLVNMYNGLSEDQRKIYVDTSTVYTWADKTKTSQTMISYKDVVETLGVIGKTAVVGSARTTFGNENTFNSTTLIIIVSVISVSVIGCLTLVVFKRRKHN